MQRHAQIVPFAAQFAEHPCARTNIMNFYRIPPQFAILSTKFTYTSRFVAATPGDMRIRNLHFQKYISNFTKVTLKYTIMGKAKIFTPIACILSVFFDCCTLDDATREIKPQSSDVALSIEEAHTIYNK